MTAAAPAKINLFLAVDGKRADGYHEVRTVLHRISLADSLSLEASEGFSLRVTGFDVPSGEENLVLRAAKLYSRTFHTGGARIALQKNIPAGAGLGGGSSDAAAALKAMRKIYGKGSTEELKILSAKLGADIPFFFEGQSAYATGTGTQLVSLPEVDLGWIVLAKPEESLSTAAVYQELSGDDYRGAPGSEDILRAFSAGNAADIINLRYNTLEAPACRILPKLRDLKRTLEETGGKALLSGSGSALFAVYPEEDDARSALQRMAPYCGWSGLFRSGEINEED